jgi:3-keto-5-aminohexanoate cleavage enzyme
MEIEIRRIQAHETAGAMRLLAAWNMAPVAPSAENPDPERSDLDSENTFVAIRDGIVVGVCSYIIHSADTAETASMAVDPSVKGLGIGYRLQMARLAEMKRRGIRRVRTETDREETIRWYVRKFGYRIIGTNPKKHAFSLPDVDHWTVLELNLEDFSADDPVSAR